MSLKENSLGNPWFLSIQIYYIRERDKKKEKAKENTTKRVY